MTKKRIAEIAKLLGRDIKRVCSFDKFRDAKKSRTTISGSAKGNPERQFRRDRKSIESILKSANIKMEVVR